MIKDEHTFELIERYLQKELEGTELAAFEQRLLSEPALKAEVKLHEELHSTMGNKELNKFQEIVEKTGAKHLSLYKQQGTKTARILPLKRFAYAAVILGIIVCAGLAFFYANQGASAEKLYASYYTVYELDSQSRSNAKTTSSAAITAYQNKNYETAAKQFESILENETNNSMAQFYLGNCYMELEKPKEALNAYKQVYESANLYTSQAKWYAALAHLELDDKAAAKELLLPLSKLQGKYAIKAKDLLKDL